MYSRHHPRLISPSTFPEEYARRYAHREGERIRPDTYYYTCKAYKCQLDQQESPIYHLDDDDDDM